MVQIISNKSQLKAIDAGFLKLLFLWEERKKFGPVGWNIKNVLNDSDRENVLDNLKKFLAEG